MSVHNALKLIGALILLALGNSFPAVASNDEKDLKTCEQELTSPPLVSVVLAAEMPHDQSHISRNAGQAWDFDPTKRWRVRIMPVGRSPDESLMADATFRFETGLVAMAAWVEESEIANPSVLKISRADSAPLLSFPLEPGETVEAYQSLPGSEADGFVAAFTDRRILVFKYSWH